MSVLHPHPHLPTTGPLRCAVCIDKINNYLLISKIIIHSHKFFCFTLLKGYTRLHNNKPLQVMLNGIKKATRVGRFHYKSVCGLFFNKHFSCFFALTYYIEAGYEVFSCYAYTLEVVVFYRTVSGIDTDSADT